MSELQLRVLRTPQELRSSAGEWDDLWLRSEVTAPGARAELVALWVDHFAPGETFRALVVEQAGRMIAALPLVNRRLKGPLKVGALPCNCWAAGGALLFDPATNPDAVLDSLVSGFSDLPWPLVWLDKIPFHEPRWQSLQATVERAGLSVTTREQYQVGQVEIGSDWDAYTSKLKGDHRRCQKRYAKKMDEAGGAELHVYTQMTPEEVDTLLRQGFEVEDRSWKGAEGTSVLKNPGIFQFYREEAELLAKYGQLELVFLEHRGQPIAFTYGWNGKGVHFMVKVGYDEAFSKFAPGHQMVMRLLEQLHSDPDSRLLDFAGPMVSFHQQWATRNYPVGPMVITTKRLLSRPLFYAYTTWQPRLRRAQQRLAGSLTSLRAMAGKTSELLGKTQNLFHQPPQKVEDSPKAKS